MKDQAKEKNRKPIFAGWRPRVGIGCGPLGCSAMVLFAAGVTILAAMVGCSQKPDPQSTVEAEKVEESAAAIDGHDSQPEEPPVVLPEPDHPCDCSPTCPCSKDRCLCATGEKCCETCQCQPAKQATKKGPAWFYCRKCGGYSLYTAPVGLKSTQCSHCKAWGAYHTLQAPPARGGNGGKVNWFGNPKRIFPGRNGLFMGADMGGSSAGCRT